LGLNVSRPRVPAYFDRLIAAYRAGHAGGDVHLGYWDDPSGLSTRCSPAEFIAAQARLTERVLDFLPLQSGQRVLDVGCGFGGTLAAIAARMPGISLVGVNLDRRQLELCAAVVVPSRGSLVWVEADAAALPFAAMAFDRIICLEAIFHFASRRAFLREAARLLAPGGRLVLTDILLRNPNNAAPWSSPQIAAVIRRDYGPWPELWVEAPTIEDWAADADLELLVGEDWTARTLPSYRTVAAPDGPLEHPHAGSVTRWLHAHGWLSYRLMAFRRR
jgi:cyclopropane fatty-acyl-phospholipid synthase-like methyltransferase